MKTTIKKLVFAISLLSMSAGAQAQDEEVVMARDAEQHEGEFVMVCGIIAETTYDRTSKGKPTYLNFTNPFPHHNFTVIVWGDDRKNFDVKPESFESHQACVYGKVELRRGKARMTISIPDQISARPVSAEQKAQLLAREKAAEKKNEARE